MPPRSFRRRDVAATSSRQARTRPGRTHPTRRPPIAAEPLERRVLLAADGLDAEQTAALLRGVAALADQFAFVQDTGVLAERAVGLEQPIGTLVAVGDELRAGLVDPLRELLVGDMTVAEVEQAFRDAALADDAAANFFSISSVSTATEGATLWIEVTLAGRRDLPRYTLDVGQGPAAIAGSESLGDRGLRLGTLEADVQAGFTGRLAFGVDRSPGLSAEQAISIKIDDAVRVFVSGSHTVADGDPLVDVDASFGAVRLGPATVDVAFDIAAEVAPTAGATPVPLGTLLATDAASLLLVAPAGDAAFDVSIPFTLSVAGFEETGDALRLGITAADLFHAADEPTGLDFVFPSLAPLDGTAGFSFEQFGDVSPSDLAASIAALRQLVPELLGAFDLPLVEVPLRDLFSATASIDTLVAAIEAPGGLPAYDTIDDLVDRLGALLGTAGSPLPASQFAIRWNAAARGLEFTLPLSYAEGSVSRSFDAAGLLPAGLPIDIAGRGHAAFELHAGLAISAGILASSAPGLPDRTLDPSSLLADVLADFDGDALIPGADFVVTLRDGSEIGVDLNPTLDGDADGIFDVGLTFATIRDAITAAGGGKLTAGFVGGRFTLSDTTSGGTPFAVRRGESGGDISLAALTLGLAVAPTDTGLLEGVSLAVSSIRDRVYVNTGVVTSAGGAAGAAAIKLDVTLDGGAAIGPLSLSVYEGVAAVEAALTVTLAHAGADADGRLTLQEIMEAGGPRQIVTHSVAAPAADGVFQLRPTPASLEAALEIGTYEGSPLATRPDDATVPFFYLEPTGSDASTWEFVVSPSEKLRQMLDGLPALSMADLPDMFELFVAELETLSFWNVDLPLIGLSLGDVFAFRDVVLAFPQLDIGGVLGLPDFGGGDGSSFTWPELSFGGLATGFLDEFTLRLSTLEGLDVDLFSLRSLSWDLEALLTEWEGWAPGDLSVDLDLLGRIRNWGLAADAAFDPVFALPDIDFGGLPAALGGLVDFLSALSFRVGDRDVSFGLGGFGSLLDAAFDLAFPDIDFPGLDLTVTQVSDGSLGGRLLFDLVVAIDWQRTIDFSTLDLDGDGLPIPLTLDGAGEMVLALGGSFGTRLGWDLAASRPLFELERTTVDVTAAIASTAAAGSNPGFILQAAIGGMSAIALGGDGAGQRRATLTLSDPGDLDPSDGLAPARFSARFDGSTGGMKAEALATLHADLPLYVAGLEHLGSLTLTGTLDTTATPPFTVDSEYVPDYRVDGDQAGQPYYASLSDVLAAAAFDPDFWKNLICQFTTTLTNGVANDFLGRLPFLGSFGFFAGDTPKVTFFKDICTALGTVDFTTPASFVDTLSEAVRARFPDPDAGTGRPATTATPRFTTGDGTPIDGGSLENWSALGPTDTVVIDLVVSGGTTLPLAAGELDIGLDGLGIDVAVGASLDLFFTLSLGLGFSVERGFFVETLAADASPELVIGASLALDEGAIRVDLGPLSLSAVDSRVAPELTAMIPLDLGTATRSYLSDLPGLLTDATVLTEGAGYGVEANLAFALSADVFGSGVGFGADLTLGYATGGVAGGGAVPFDALFDATGRLDPSKLYFSLTDVGIDLGGLLGGEKGPIRSMMARIAEALEPVQPIIDLLTAEVPLVSDLSKRMGQGAVTFLTLVKLQDRELGTQAETFLDTVSTVSTLARTLKDVAATGRVSLGSLTPKADSRAKLAGDGTVTSADFDTAPPSGSSATSADGVLAELRELGIAFPILEGGASQLFGLLFGKDVDLITWDVPDLDGVGFHFDQSFPIFGPLFASVFGAVGFSTHLDVGYDTRGIRQALAGEDVRLARTVNGFYFDDLGGGGDDVAEASLTATIGAGAQLDVLVARAGVDGGLRGEIGANLRDQNADGKVHLDEFARLLAQGPQCIFDFSGSLDVFLDAFLKLGFGTPFGFVTLFSDRLNLLEIELFNWTAVTCPPAAPNLADVLTAAQLNTLDPSVAPPAVGALVLNMGARAGIDDRDDEGEEFLIEQRRDEDGAAVPGWIVVKALEYEEMFEIASFDLIWFDAGLGADVVTIASDIPDFAPRVHGYGGTGNDRLTGGRGRNTFFGQEGNDSLVGHNDVDQLVGGDGDDYLIGYGAGDRLVGDDPEADYAADPSVIGGDGDDRLFGDDEEGNMHDVPAAFAGGTPGDDDLFGGGGNDVGIGGAGDDRVRGGGGDDTLAGGDGTDTVIGDEGNDQLSGGAGDDTMYGDDAAGLLAFGAADINADFMEGGAGFNIMAGGPGNDTIYAHSEALGEAAPSTGAASSGWASWLIGDDGCDTLYGTTGSDRLEGRFDSDALYAGVGDDLVLGGPGGDLIVHRGSVDHVVGGLFGGHGNDVIDGCDGRDYVEGGPGDDRIYGRLGADEIYGGTTFRGYQYLLDDWSMGRTIVAAIHGGFTAVAGDSCEPVVSYHPEVYPETGNHISVTLFEDKDNDGVRDTGDVLAPVDLAWTLQVVDASGSWLVYDAFPGGTSTITDGGIPDGTHRVAAASIPFGWQASTVRDTTVSVTGGQTASVEFGFWRYGQIGGRVTRKQGNDSVGAGQVVVYLDADGDDAFDADEPFTFTDTDGTYTLLDVAPGRHRVTIAGLGDHEVLTPDFRDVDVTSGDASPNVDFDIAVSGAPVVTAVYLGTVSPGVAWTPIPDGKDQIDPLLRNPPFRQLAVDFAAEGIDRAAGLGATLQPITSTGAPVGAAVQLVFLSERSFAGSGAIPMQRFEWAIHSLSDQNGLAAGWYELRLSAAAFKDGDGDGLDGEWANPTPLSLGGSQFPSGNGTAGGDFAFRFLIADEGTSGGGGGQRASGAAAAGVIQGVLVQQDGYATGGTDAAAGVPLVGRTVVLTGTHTGVERTTTSGPIDLDGDGQVRAAETAAFRFTGLPADEYVVRVDDGPAGAWRLAGGGIVNPGVLLAATFDRQSNKASLQRLDTSTMQATALPPLQGFVPRDIAAVSSYQCFVTGTQLQANGVTPQGQAGLWLVSTWNGGATDLGPTPGGKPLVALDALDSQHLIGADANGQVFTYDIFFRRWSPLGPLTLDTGATLYPVGDFAKASPNVVYAICLTVPLADLDQADVSKQVLVRFDPTRRGATATLVRELSKGTTPLTELLVGLETSQPGTLLALSRERVLFEIPVAATSSIVRLGAVTDLPAVSYGGLARSPGQFTQGYDPEYRVTIDGNEGGDGGVVDLDIGLQVGLALEDGDDVIDGGCGLFADVLHGDDFSLPWGVTSIGGHDVIRGRDGDDTIVGGLLGDRLRGDAGADTISGGTTDSNWIDGGADGDTLTGGDRADVIHGQGGRDTLVGHDGGDMLFGGSEADDLLGERGDDVLVAGAGEDAKGDTVSGGDGDDVLYVVASDLGGDFATVPTGTAPVRYAGEGGTDTLVLTADLATITLTDATLDAYGVDQLAAIEVAILTGGGSANRFDASAFTGRTVLRGAAGNDELIGGSGADDIHGGTGSNRLVGHAGDDRFFLVDGETAEIVETVAIGSGSDTVDATATTFALAVRVGALLEGVDLRGLLSALAPAATFSRAAVETILLGSRDDRVTIRDAQVTVATIDAGAGTDMLTYTDLTGGWAAWSTSVAVDLAAGTATGLGGLAGFERVIGGDAGDVLRGDAGRNRLEGGDGADDLHGEAGDDEIYGGGGGDRLYGGANHDLLIGGAGLNRLEGGTGDDTYWFTAAGQTDTLVEDANQGFDAMVFDVGVATSVAVTIDAAIHAAFGGGSVTAAVPKAIERIQGGKARDVFRLDEGSLFAGLLAGGGAPGSSWNDLDVLDYSDWTTGVVVAPTAPLDAEYTATASGTAGIVGIRHVIGGTGADRFTAGAAAVWFEGGDGEDVLEGSPLADRLEGGNDRDTLRGHDGADHLFGGQAADTLDGGAGDDRYGFAALFGDDTIVEASGGGRDLLDFATVAAPLQVRIGSVSVSDGMSTARHADSHVEEVIGGTADDTFVMTGPTVVFPGVLDGGAGSNHLRYESASQAIIDAVGAGQTPNMDAALRFASVTAINNLHAPVFGGGFTNAIKENQPAATTIAYQVLASDADIAPYNVLSYALKTGLADDAGLVTIDAAGAVRLKTPANFEARNAYRFTVVVTDSGLPTRSTERAITVNILNEPERLTPPQIAMPSRFEVVEDTPGPLVFPESPFTDADSVLTTVMTVTLRVRDGAIAGVNVPGSGIGIGGTPTARTFTGQLQRLSAYFSSPAGHVTYTPAANVSGERTLTATIAERAGGRVLSTTKTVPITIVPVNDLPVVTAPAFFSAREDVPAPLRWPVAPTAFVDPDADPNAKSLTVTLAVDAGAITARSTTKVEVSGTPTARIFRGSPADLTAYFRAAGAITYTTARDDDAPRTLTITAMDEEISRPTTVVRPIRVTPVNDVPTLATLATLFGGGLKDTGYEITFADLRDRLGLSDVDSAAPTLLVSGVRQGRLERYDALRPGPEAARWVAVNPAGPVAQRQLDALRFTKVRWTPPAGLVGKLQAFQVRGFDGAAQSTTPATVSVELAGG